MRGFTTPKRGWLSPRAPAPAASGRGPRSWPRAPRPCGPAPRRRASARRSWRSMSGRCCSTQASENSMGSPTASSSMRTTVFAPAPARCSGSAARSRSSRSAGARARRRSRSTWSVAPKSSNGMPDATSPCVGVVEDRVGQPARLDDELHRARVDRDAVLLHHRDRQQVVAVAPAVRRVLAVDRHGQLLELHGDVAVELTLHVQQVHLLAGAQPKAVATPRVESGLHLAHVREVLARDHTPDLVVVRCRVTHELRRRVPTAGRGAAPTCRRCTSRGRRRWAGPGT